MATVSTGGGYVGCAAPLTTTFYNETLWEWDYSVSTGSYQAYAYNVSDESGGTWSNLSVNLNAIPSPFKMNNTSLYYHYAGWTTTGSCEEVASVGTEVYAYLYDARAGYEIPYSGTDLPVLATLEIAVYNDTDYGWENLTYWVGPANYSLAIPGSYFWADSWGASTSKEVCDSLCSYSNSTSTPSRLMVAYTADLSGDSVWWNGNFSPTDRYWLVLEFHAAGIAENVDWGRGSASFRVDAAMRGGGIDLRSIYVT